MGKITTNEMLASALTVQRQRLNVIASNIANAQTTRTAEGGPYKRKDIVVVAEEAKGSFESVLDEMTIARPKVAAVIEDNSEPRKVYQPGHPDADTQGYVAYPNINIVSTMTDMMSASSAYQASLTALGTSREFARSALDLIK